LDDDILLTSDEVIALLQINRRTLYRLIARGGIPARRVGRHWRFRRVEMMRWLHKQPEAPVTTSLPGRVLVVDDEEVVRNWLHAALLDSGFQTDAAPDGATALSRLADSAYDVVIVDLRMPGMDGLAVVRHIRQRSDTLPVVIVTGHSTEASAVEALNLGVSGYLTKPFRLPQLLRVLYDALKRGR